MGWQSKFQLSVLLNAHPSSLFTWDIFNGLKIKIVNYHVYKKLVIVIAYKYFLPIN